MTLFSLLLFGLMIVIFCNALHYIPYYKRNTFVLSDHSCFCKIMVHIFANSAKVCKLLSSTLCVKVTIH